MFSQEVNINAKFYLLGYNIVQCVEKPTAVSQEHVASIFKVEE
jgi:hypothetical protein